LSPISSSDIDFVYQVFNADGSEAGQCGNGVRCLAKFVKNQKHSLKNELIFATKNTKTKTFLEQDGQVTAVTQGPIFEPKDIPLIAKAKALRYNQQILNGKEIEFGAVSMGNPHAVVLVDNIATAPVETMGPLISNSKLFPERANVSFMQVMDSKHIKLRVYERGSGETLACGSGACASVVIGKTWGFLAADVVVKLYGGDLVVKWDEANDVVWITGPVELVYNGEINLVG
jgi:diaminopimelate epimerase